jgi:hypothetical protein
MDAMTQYKVGLWLAPVVVAIDVAACFIRGLPHQAAGLGQRTLEKKDICTTIIRYFQSSKTGRRSTVVFLKINDPDIDSSFTETVRQYNVEHLSESNAPDLKTPIVDGLRDRKSHTQGYLLEISSIQWDGKDTAVANVHVDRRTGWDSASGVCQLSRVNSLWQVVSWHIDEVSVLTHPIKATCNDPNNNAGVPRLIRRLGVELSGTRESS